jgi:hypothetical protein
MALPQRIQRKRSKGWRLPAGAVCVTRPGRFGNPYPVSVYGLDLSLALFAETATGRWNTSLCDAVQMCDELLRATYNAHRRWLRRLDNDPLEFIRSELRGKDLACWCPLPAEGQPDRCHAAELLRIANE